MWNSEHPGEPARQPEPWTGPNHAASLDTAEGKLAAARRLLQDAEELRGAAASTAAATIGDAADDDLKNDTSLWGSIKRGAKWLVDHAPIETLAQWCSTLAGIVGVAALLLAWVPVLGQVLGIAALVLGGPSLVFDSILAMSGEADWSAVAWDAIGLATFGIGRAAGAAARGARALRSAETGLDTGRTSARAARIAHPTRAMRRALRRGDTGGYDRSLSRTVRHDLIGERKALKAAEDSAPSRDWVPEPRHFGDVSPRAIMQDLQREIAVVRKEGLLAATQAAGRQHYGSLAG